MRRVEYDKLVALGVFEGERIELIDGALLHMSPIGPPHECGIPEYWIVNLANRSVEVHRVPNAGQYEQVSVFAKGSRIGLVSFPDVELNVDDFVR